MNPPVIAIDRLDDAQLGDLHALYQEEWWTRGRTLEQTRLAVAQSSLALGYAERDSGRLVAFARVLTDRAFKALVLDVVVRRDHRGGGLGAALMTRLLGHPDLASVRHVELYCLPEVAPFYARFGFSAELGTLKLMRRG